jgi:nucleoside-diphosphate-sugar epimerase
MKIFVIGASGRVGTALVNHLVTAGHSVTAGTRHTTQDFGAHVETVPFDLGATPTEMSKQLAGHDALYFVAGSRGKDLLRIDAFGPVKVAQAAKLSGVKRFILLSSSFADDPSKWIGPGFDALEEYNIAKFFADHWIMEHDALDYTILQPGSLVEKPATGNITLTITKPGENAIEDVAAVLANLVSAKNTIKKVVTMHEGTTPILEAIKNF